MTFAELVALRRFQGRCYYCGSSVARYKLTCRGCSDLPAIDPGLDLADEAERER